MFAPIVAITRGDVAAYVNALFTVYIVLIFLRILLSWVPRLPDNDVKAALHRDFETNIKTNGYVLGQLLGKYQLGEAPESLLAVPSYYDKITAATIQTAAKTYLDTSNYIKVVLMPEKK